MKKLNVAVLGSTGSIGRNACSIIAAYPDRFRTVGLVGCSQTELLAHQAERLGAEWAAANAPDGYEALLKYTPRAVRGERLTELVTAPEVDVVLCAIVGTAGLPLVMAALAAGKRVALASKEVLVMAGELVEKILASGKGELTPVDSEHSAIFQCLAGRDRDEIAKLVLTASGGALRDFTRAELERATLRQVLSHPTWNMGRKVTIDSATLMNKALELIEAKFLFGFPPEKLKAVIHPQSVVHSMVELCDGSMIAQMSAPDMRFAIGYAMSCPERLGGAGLPRLDFAALPPLEFREVDEKRFPSLGFAYEALRAGGTMPAVMNAANEIAVDKFVRGGITLPRIWGIVEKTMEAHRPRPVDGLETVLAADAWARGFAAGVN
ncbi:MAG: 1-deoxy-D-xylulose-5-phosphate reductoisomerase [Victivallaceae bacterium]